MSPGPGIEKTMTLRTESIVPDQPASPCNGGTLSHPLFDPLDPIRGLIIA
jgi:hypothetical protein